MNELKDYSIKGSLYTGLPIDDDYCPWTLNVYPSDTLKQDFTSDNATIFAITAAVVFIATSLVFIIYDRWVEKRQDVVMTSAVQTRAIVSSLFPSNVQDRIFDLDGADGKQSGGKGNNTSRPVADVYAETTVCFIDIA